MCEICRLDQEIEFQRRNKMTGKDIVEALNSGNQESREKLIVEMFDMFLSMIERQTKAFELIAKHLENR